MSVDIPNSQEIFERIAGQRQQAQQLRTDFDQMVKDLGTGISGGWIAGLVIVGYNREGQKTSVNACGPVSREVIEEFCYVKEG